MKRILLTIATVMMSWCVIADEWIDAKAGIKWTYWVSPDNEVEIQGIDHYQGDAFVPGSDPYGDVVVPSLISGKPVTSISGFAFLGKAMSSISMPDSIKTIGDGAFKQCGTTMIHLPAALTTIGNETFLGCQQMKGLYLPSTVTSLGIRVFEDCHALTDVSIPAGITEVPEGAFAACSSLTNVVLHSGITSIGDRAFSACTSLKEITLPSSVVNLGREAFSGCTITSIDIPEGVESIPDGLFAGCLSLESVSIPASVKAIGDSSFMSCEKLQSVDLSDNVISIGAYAFSYCKSFATFKIPANLTTLSDRMLGNCESLETIEIPQCVTNVSDAFWYCKKLKKVELPTGVHGSCSFQGCEALAEVILPDGITGFDINYCTHLRYLTMPSSITKIPSYQFDCLNLKMITFKGDAPNVSDHAFSFASVGCVSVPEGSSGWDDDGDGKWCGIPVVYRKPDGGPYKETVDGIEWTYVVRNGEATVGTGDSRVAIPVTTQGEITIPSILGGCRVVNIGDNAFGDCRKLTRVTICEGVRRIGVGAFNNCYGISVSIPLTVTSIGARAFHGTHLIEDGVSIIDNCLISVGYDLASEDVVLPEGTRLIADQACSGSAMTSLSVPSSMQHIGEGAFIECNELQTITISTENPRYACEDGILSDKNIGELLWCSPSKSPVDIPANTRSIGNYAFYHRGNLYGIEIPSSVTNIGDHAFESCGLGSVTIPSSVQRIGDFAFGGCNGLWSVTIPNSVEIIGEYAFSWTGIPQANIGESVGVIGNSAFSGCSALTSATIPSSVSNIDSYAFSNCGALTNVVFGGNAPEVGTAVFDGVAEGCTATVHKGTTGWDNDGDDKWQGLTLRWVIDDCISFMSEGGFTLKTASMRKGWDVGMWWSGDKVSWTEWTGEEISAARVGDGNDYRIYVRGAANTTVSYIFSGAKWALNPSGNNTIACSGNIETLRGATGDAPADTPMGDTCYYELFSGCKSLTTAPKLPATCLAQSCYARMFQGCTSLTTAPELIATALTNSCYAGMFKDCTSLTKAPILPATTLAECCYDNMFWGCKSLIAAPELPATILAYECYDWMFYGCTALTTAPSVLPATTLEADCYDSMFKECISLTNAPVILATELAGGCCSEMFNGCTSLKKAPELPATTLCRSCYAGMFSGCVSVTNIPMLPATTLSAGCYSGMFNGCTSLATKPILPAMTLADECYQNMFHGCTALTDVPELPATVLAHGCYNMMFYGCTGIKMSEAPPGKKWSIPTGATTSGEVVAYSMFSGTGGDFTGAPEVGKTYYVGAEKTELAGGFTAQVYDGECTITGAGELTDVSALKSKGVTNLVIGAGVTKVGDAAFQGWRSLLGVTLGEDCTALGANAFKKCSYLNSVRGGANLASVGAKAFYFCLSLETISLDGTMPEGLADSVIIQTAIDSDGKPYLIPNISIAGYNQVLFGKKSLNDDGWINIGSPDQDMQETDYSFFQIRLVPKGE